MLEETRYMAYLLRLWVSSHGETLTCRAVLLDPHSGEQRGFADLESLFRTIKEAVEKETQTDKDGRRE